MKQKFEKKLKELSYSYQCTSTNLYQLVLPNNDTLILQFVMSEAVNIKWHGSHNGNETQAIAYFILNYLLDNDKPDFYVFAFDNETLNRPEFVVIQANELRRRIYKRSYISLKNKDIDLVLWLMPDSCLYEATHISIEGEWFFISKGLGRRMADNTDKDFTKFLNNWNSLIMNC